MINALPELCFELPYSKDSTTVFSRIRNLDWPIYLDSANTGGESGRYDIMSASPFVKVRTYGTETHIESQSGELRNSKEDPFKLLDNLLQQYIAEPTTLPFAGGALGYFAYDLGRRIESIPAIAQDAEHLPEMAIGLYDWAIVVDHKDQQAWLCSHGLNQQTYLIWEQLQQLLTEEKSQDEVALFKITSELHTNLSKKAYDNAFNRIQHYIVEGDCYQVNLAKRFEVEAEGDPWTAFKVLRQQNAAPFSAYFEIPDATILSSSPERLLQVKSRQVETKPIKGTRPRDLENELNDKSLAEALLSSTKDRAENLMIVDLLRNDLGKVCLPGSIKVPKAFALESFATVHHLVSTIQGELSEQESSISLLRACFPGGSITGAPKLRAMEIIEELEPHRRGVYCGSVGYIGFDGNMDTNITIRTLIFNQNKLRFWAGGGIVRDSNVDEEHQEVQDKAAAMFKLIETLS